MWFWIHWTLLVAYSVSVMWNIPIVCIFLALVLRVPNMFFCIFFHHFFGKQKKVWNKDFPVKTNPISDPKSLAPRSFPLRSPVRWPQGTGSLLWLWHGSLALNRRVQLGMSRQDGVLVLLFTGALGDEGDARDARDGWLVTNTAWFGGGGFAGSTLLSVCQWYSGLTCSWRNDWSAWERWGCLVGGFFAWV